MIVFPIRIDISSNRIVAYQEPGFGLQLPRGKAIQLQTTFSKAVAYPGKKSKKNSEYSADGEKEKGDILMYDIQTRSWTGIQTNMAMVQSLEIAFSNKKGPAVPQEPGFTFAFPEDKQRMLKKIFLDGAVESGNISPEERDRKLKTGSRPYLDLHQRPNTPPILNLLHTLHIKRKK